MCGILYSSLGKYSTGPTAKGRANAVAAIKRLAVRAAALDVTLGLEVVNRYETNLINTAEQAMAFVTDVDEPNVLIHLDSYHMNIEEKSLRDAVHVCGIGSGMSTWVSRTGARSARARWTLRVYSGG